MYSEKALERMKDITRLQDICSWPPGTSAVLADMFLFFPDQHQVLVSDTVYVLNTCCLRYRGRLRNSQRNRIPGWRQPLFPKYIGRFYDDRIVPSQSRSLRFSSNGVRTFAADNTLVIRLHAEIFINYGIKQLSYFVLFQRPKTFVPDIKTRLKEFFAWDR